jgi:16S rRNA (guanine527-N7)-methyltransferase
MSGPAGDSPAALAGIVDVSRETRDRISAYLDLLREWQPAENLVAPSTLPHLWERHVADSAQLVALKPDGRRWLDLGSGAGFPGMVVAMLLAGRPGAEVRLVESNARKCAFLRQAIRVTAAPASVLQGRIEAVVPPLSADPPDIVTARALAPLSRLLDLAAPVMAAGATGLFPKGREFEGEIRAAQSRWQFDLVQHPSRIDTGGVILEIRDLRPRDGPSP